MHYIKDSNFESRNWEEKKKTLKDVRIFFQILTYINFRQTNAMKMNFFTQALCWQCYSKPNNLVVMQFIKYSKSELKNWLKHEKYQNLEVKPDLKICWFAITQVCFFSSTPGRSEKKYFFLSFWDGKDSINPYDIFVTKKFFSGMNIKKFFWPGCFF